MCGESFKKAFPVLCIGMMTYNYDAQTELNMYDVDRTNSTGEQTTITIQMGNTFSVQGTVYIKSIIDFTVLPR